MNTFASLCTRAAFGSYARLASPRLSILIFHRVHADTDPIFPGEPDAARFDRMMRLVAGSFRVMSLGHAIRALANGTLPGRAMVITFDDGYADNADVALPILQRHGLTASFFVSTGFLNGGRMWNDSVIECVRSCGRSEIDLEEFQLGRLSISSADQRRQAIAALLPKLKYMALQDRQEAVASLQRIAGVAHLPQQLMMSSQQVQALHSAGMEIGAHTVNHPILAAIEPAQAEREIAQSKQELESIVNASVDVLAYPNGKPHQDYNAGHVAMAKRLGFQGAVSTAAGAAQTGDDLFQLPRFTPWATSMPLWAMRLWLNQRNSHFDRVGHDEMSGSE